MNEPLTVRSAKNSWVVALLAVVLYFVSSQAGGQLDGRTGALAAGIGSLCATFLLLGALALSIIGLCGIPKHGAQGILLPALLGLFLSAGPIALVVGFMLTSAFE